MVESMQTPTPPIKGEVSLSYCVERPRVEVVVVVVVIACVLVCACYARVW